MQRNPKQTERWVRDWQEGKRSEDSFRRLYEAYSRPIVFFFKKQGFSREECWDLCQETFIRVYRGMKSFRLEASFETWLFGIARNVWRNRVRDRSTQKRSGEEVSLDPQPDSEDAEAGSGPAAGLEDEGIGPLDEVLVDERLRLVREAMRDLSPQRQCVLILFVTHELSYSEIGDLLEIPVGTVKSQLFKARSSLRKTLGDRYTDIDLAERKEAS